MPDGEKVVSFGKSRCLAGKTGHGCAVFVNLLKFCEEKMAGERRLNEITSFHHDIKTILEQARGKACSAVNAAMVEAYWLIGQRIVQEEQQGQHKAQYGERLLVNLSKELSISLGKGFSFANFRNFRNFRQFYLAWPAQAICYTVCNKLSWNHSQNVAP